MNRYGPPAGTAAGAVVPDSLEGCGVVDEVALRPKAVGTRAGFIAALIAHGMPDEARAQAAALLGFRPNFNLEDYSQTVPYADSSVREQLLAALHEAGLPESSPRPSPE